MFGGRLLTASSKASQTSSGNTFGRDFGENSLCVGIETDGNGEIGGAESMCAFEGEGNGIRSTHIHEHG